MTIVFALPLIFTLGIAFATAWSLGATPDRSLGRLALVFAAIEIGLVLIAVVLALVDLQQPREERCPIGDREWTAGIVILFATAIAGGLLLATVLADGRRQKGVLVWHLLAAPAAVVLPYVAGFAYLFWGLSCSS